MPIINHVPGVARAVVRVLRSGFIKPAGRQRRWRGAFDSFAGDRRGVVAILFALMLPVLVAFAGIGTEVALWFSVKRDLQTAVDAAAIAASYEVVEGRSFNVGTIARRAAESNGWNAGDGTITIRNSQYNATYPASGSHTSDADAVEVELTMAVKRMFTSWFMSDDLTINARAVASRKTTEACVLALGSGNPSQAVKSGGAATNMTLDGCSAAINSTASQALSVTEGSLTADCMYIQGAGGYSGSPTTTQCAAPVSGQAEVPDPYASIAEPTPSSCDAGHTGYALNSGSDTIAAGTWCDGINATGDTLTMNSGLYIIDQGNFKITGGASVSAANVTVVLMDGSGGGNCGVFEISGGGSINMTARTSGAYAGILFFRHSSCGFSAGDMKLVGGATATVVGVIYSPTKEVKISSGTTLSGSCLQIVADTIELSGSGIIGNDCDGTGVTPIEVGSKGILVE